MLKDRVKKIGVKDYSFSLNRSITRK